MDQVVADGDDLTPRPPLDGDSRADVAIVGAGYTGLWTAYHLLRGDPGCGSSWSSGRSPGSGRAGATAAGARRCSRRARRADPPPRPRRRARDARGDARPRSTRSGKAVAEEGIACDWVKGGTVTLARTPAQLRRARAEGGFLAADEASALVGATRVLGASYTPDCARIQPARLVRGLARAVERRGGRIVEGTDGDGGRAAAGGDRPGRRHARAPSSAPPRRGRPSSCRGRWCRCTR